MPAYRYILFPPGRQPTAEEVRQLHAFDGVLTRRYAFGADARDGRLAIAFDQTVYDYAHATEPLFEDLVGKWTARGCELLDHLAFIKDPAALRPTPVAQSRAHAPPQPDRILTAKELAAKEAVARSRLSVHQSIARYAALQRLAALVPYLLIALATLALIAAGLYVTDRLQNAGQERRQQTIDRVLDDPMDQPLRGQTKADESRQ